MPAHDPFRPSSADAGSSAPSEVTDPPQQPSGDVGETEPPPNVDAERTRWEHRDDTPNYDDMDKRALMNLAHERGLTSWGSKAQLVRRLREWDSA